MIRIFSHFVPARFALLLLLEAIVVSVAAFAGMSIADLSGAYPGRAQLEPALAALPFGVLLIINSMGLYQVEGTEDRNMTRPRLLVAGLLACLLCAVMSRLAPSESTRPDALAAILLFAICGSALTRFLVFKYGNAPKRKRRVLVLGTGCPKFAEAARKNLNHTIVGYVAIQPGNSDGTAPVFEIKPNESLLSLVQKHRIDEIVIAKGDRRGGALPVQDLLQCRLSGVNVIELASYFEREYRQVLLESLNPSWLVFGDGFNAGVARAIVKRCFDVLASLGLLLVTSPVLLIAAACIVVESPGSLLYRQQRVGASGRLFTVYKLRSMRNDAENDGKPRWAVANDQRITRVGAFLRKLRIDELPQIFNVLKGDMSFIGPRPERPFFVDQLSEQIPYYAMRHTMKPGITGWAQVRFPYGASLEDAVEKLQYDLYYVKNNGLFLDLMIFFATIEVVLWGRGAR